jgi:hypothetical protein
LNYKNKYNLDTIAVSTSSSWALWIFRKKILESISKNYKIIILSRENFFLKKITFRNKVFFLKHKFILFFNNIFYLKNKKIKKFIEYDIKNLFFHLFAKFFIDYKLIVICAGLGSYYNNKGYFNFLEKIILWIIFRPVNLVFFINKYDNKILTKIIKKKNATIPSEGYSLKFFPVKKKLNNKISFVLGARPIKEKGILEYIKVSKIFPSCNFYLYIVGNDKKKIFYNSKILNFHLINLPKNLIIKKEVKNFVKEIRSYDCLISNSYGEGFGNTLADATCAGIPIISTKTNGAKYIFKKKSLIWTEIKSLKSLQQNISKFLNLNQSQRITMVKHARKDVLKIKTANVLKKIKKYL